MKTAWKQNYGNFKATIKQNSVFDLKVGSCDRCTAGLTSNVEPMLYTASDQTAKVFSALIF